MATYVVLAKFTDQGIRNAKESPKRAATPWRKIDALGSQSSAARRAGFDSGQGTKKLFLGRNCASAATRRSLDSGPAATPMAGMHQSSTAAADTL